MGCVVMFYAWVCFVIKPINNKRHTHTHTHTHAHTHTQETPIDEVAGIDTCAKEKKQHEVNVGISNSFGFGGHNSVVAFAPYKNGSS